MPASYLHGVEFVESVGGPLPIQVVRSAVVGLVGSAPMFAATGALPLWNFKWVITLGQQVIDSNGNVQTCTTAGTTNAAVAPTWATALNATTVDGTVTWTLTQVASALGLVNNPTLVGSGNGAANFGPMIQGYTIPYTLNAIQQQGAGQVIVVNVFDQTVHFTAVAAGSFNFPASGIQAISLGHMGVSNVLVTNTGATITYTLGTDFTLDAVNGIILQKTGTTMTVGQAIKVSYNYADPSKITDPQLIGTITGSVYTGMQAWLTTYNSMGFFPKILIAPSAGSLVGGTAVGWQTVGSGDATVAAALTTIAGTLRGIALIDSPPAISVATAIANRSNVSSVFNTSSKRNYLCFPNLLFVDQGIIPTGATFNSAGVAVQAFNNGNVDSPYSRWMAGVMAAKDMAQGYWWSPSNTPIIGVVGPDIPMYQSLFDPNSDPGNLNAAGIATTFNSFGTGVRAWGNRSAAYPSSTAPDNFISVRRTIDVLEDSVQLFAMQFLDAPMSNALITAILQATNSFVRQLIARGALVGGLVSFDPGNNPVAQLAAGQLVFTINVMPPPPAERLTFNTTININLLNNLIQPASTQQSSF